VISVNRENAKCDPRSNNTSHHQAQKTTATTVASVSFRQKLQPPLPASLTTTLHRPGRHISSSSNCNKAGADFFLFLASSRSIRVAG